MEREQAAVNDMFLRNKQWVYWNRATNRLEELPREPARVRATVAKIGPDSRRIISKLMRRPLVFDVRPTSPDDAAIRASRIAEAALLRGARHAALGGPASRPRQRRVGARCRRDQGRVGLTRSGTPIGCDEQGRMRGTGDVKLDVVSIHEIACEPGTRDLETGAVVDSRRGAAAVRGQADVRSGDRAEG